MSARPRKWAYGEPELHYRRRWIARARRWTLFGLDFERLGERGCTVDCFSLVLTELENALPNEREGRDLDGDEADVFNYQENLWKVVLLLASFLSTGIYMLPRGSTRPLTLVPLDIPWPLRVYDAARRKHVLNHKLRIMRSSRGKRWQRLWATPFVIFVPAATIWGVNCVAIKLIAPSRKANLSDDEVIQSTHPSGLFDTDFFPSILGWNRLSLSLYV
ncbi:hypothetical protein ARMGADRAFT_1090498 [Armillaria gallica]|uniref:Uncharacterized protein n=1 Tax=Armillaria gallica TaxID=47427 RepID=A0A2H3CV24_ARMGA|nr:hypothetical protein ARMGADRAFT_1090498 [Armillaria gallica]